MEQYPDRRHRPGDAQLLAGSDGDALPRLWCGWSPPVKLIRFTEDPLGNLGMFLVPGLILGTALAASTMRAP